MPLMFAFMTNCVGTQHILQLSVTVEISFRFYWCFNSGKNESQYSKHHYTSQTCHSVHVCLQAVLSCSKITPPDAIKPLKGLFEALK